MWTKAFDGSPNTFWHTAFSAGTTPPPHEICIDLGAVHPVAGFRYLPRQDGFVVGNISQYEFYVSLDGAAWGTPVTSGTFASSSTEKEVLFLTKDARYVRLRSLAGADCNVAELTILQGRLADPPAEDPNNPPVFKASPVTRAAGSEQEPYTGGSLADAAADPDPGDLIVFSKISGPAWLEISSNGSLAGTPPEGSKGSNSFTVRATDPAGAFDDAVLLIEIQSAALPLPWEVAQLGAGGPQGQATWDSGTFTMEASGRLAGKSDSGWFIWQTLSGDGEIAARVDSVEDTGRPSRYGLMIRNSLAPNSRHVFIGVNGNSNFRLICREETGGPSDLTTGGGGNPPAAWIRLVRSGTTVTAYKSADGAGWTSVGATTTDFGANCYIGISASGGKDRVGTATFRDVSVTP